MRSEHARPGLLDRSHAELIARTLRAIADPTRVQILSLIVEAADGRPVTELADELGLTQPTVSHHLRILSDEGVVERSRRGRHVWYSVVPSRMGDVFDSVRTEPVRTEPVRSGPTGTGPVAASIAPAVLARISRDLATRFAGTFSPETITEYVHASHRLLAEKATITRQLPSLTSRFTSDRLRALAVAHGLNDDGMPNVLFVCVQNAGRSQLASAMLRSLAGDSVRVVSAGSAPSGSISPTIIAALDEIGVPIDGEYSKPLTDEVVRAADYVITMGCGDACPIYPGTRYLDWDLPDPLGLSMGGVRDIRDDIDRRVRELLVELEALNIR
ncbi:MAG: hypothetical protein RI885_1911 [Actinomycetota bacterium]|jgi:protein-tyrosine-phosphatase/DNA-binding transcriptional ArsR family regulator